MVEKINISRMHFPVTTLGPGQRIGIWFQGCSIKCAGCISVDTWQSNVGVTSISEVMDQIKQWSDGVDGITITGGEPFEQSTALESLLKEIHNAYDFDVLVYSGFLKDEILAPLARLDGLVDALISGPYVADEPDTLPLRGSDNQELHLLTDKGKQLFAKYNYEQANSPTIDLMLDECGTVWMCGIPKKDEMRKLRSILVGQGHEVIMNKSAAYGELKNANSKMS